MVPIDTEADALTATPDVGVPVGAEILMSGVLVYPEPALVRLRLVTVPDAFINAVAVAATPPGPNPPTKVTLGGDV